MYNTDGTDINKVTVLETISQEEIFKRYLGVEVDLDSLLINPLRDDVSPTCTFKWIGNKLYFRDWSEPKAKDCFDIVKQIYNCSFGRAIDIVATDFGLKNGDVERPKISIVPKHKDPVNLQIKRQELTKLCISYWASQGISKRTLDYYNVVGVRAIWIRGNKVYDWSVKDIAFAYQFPNNLIKIYFPMRKGKGKVRFFNTDNTVLEGFAQLPPTGDLLVITKSLKDVMALYEYGIPAVAPASEVIGLNPFIMDVLRSRFKCIYSLMDNDWTGRRAAIRLRRAYGITPLIFPLGEPKDVTDNYVKHGHFYMLDLIDDFKKNIECS